MSRKRRDGAERHHVGRVRAGAQILDIADRQPERIVGLRRDPVGPAQDVEVVDEGRAHVGRQRVEEARDRHAQHLGLGAVDVGVDLRRRGVEQREDLDEAGRLVGAGRAMPPTACSSARGPRPARSCTYSLKPPPVPMPGTEGGGITSTKASRKRLHLAAQVVEDAVGREPCLHPLFERLQGDEDDARSWARW